MAACRQCGKMWASDTVHRPPLVNGLCLACRRRIEAAEQAAGEAWCEHCGFRPATTAVHRGLCQDCRASYRHGLALWLHDFFWEPGAALATLVAMLVLAVTTGAIGGLILGVPGGIVLGGFVGLFGFFLVIQAARPEEHTVTLPPPTPRERARERGVSLGPSQTGAPTLPAHTVTLPPPEQASQTRRPLTTLPARQHNPAKGVTRPGMSTLERPSKQPPHGSSRAAEKWPPPPRVRPYRKG